MFTRRDICGCEFECIDPLPVLGGRNIGMYSFDDSDPKCGYICGGLYELFTMFKSQSRKPREDVSMYPTVDLDESADRWLWGLSGPEYSSQPRFEKWLEELASADEARTINPRLL